MEKNLERFGAFYYDLMDNLV